MFLYLKDAVIRIDQIIKVLPIEYLDGTKYTKIICRGDKWQDTDLPFHEVVARLKEAIHEEST